jgi:hypothetical protein
MRQRGGEREGELDADLRCFLVPRIVKSARAPILLRGDTTLERG